MYGVHHIYEYFGTPLEVDTPLPEWKCLCIQVLMFMVIEDCLGYWTHRSLHTPFLYKYKIISIE
jgi:sterol desaturase/sphingolipid hydroxylase (fatty acid hydroxylase superfamily)